MLVLVGLLFVCGIIFTFSLGVTGYLFGPLVVLAGGFLLWDELGRRRTAREDGRPLPRRSGGKRFLIGFSSVVLAICGLFALVMQLTSALPATADHFFQALKAGDQEKARTYLAEGFLASTSDDELRRWAEKTGLSGYQSASWSSRGIHNTEGKLEGTLETSGGGSIPIAMTFVREDDQWKILSLRKPDAGILADDERPRPNSTDQSRLAHETTQLFADAVTQKDFTDFYKSTASLWQREVTVKKLNDAFKSFSQAGVDLHQLEGEPNISSAKFDDDGAFAIEGTYPFGPNRFEFRYRYVYEGLDWKLVGVSAHLR